MMPGGLLRIFTSVAVQSACGTVNWLKSVDFHPIFCIPDWNALAMYRLYGSLLVTMAIVLDDGTHCLLAMSFCSSTTNPGPYQVSDGSPWKMFVIPRCLTKSTLPCHVFTWKVGIFACATIGNSTELYVQNPQKMAATFCETNFWNTFFMTSGC